MVRLNVPYVEKDQAKALGARWNYQGRFWYCEEDQTDRFTRWLIPNGEGEIEDEPRPESGKPERDSYETVTAVSLKIATIYDNTQIFQCIRVRGEVSNHSLWNGHHFFTIRDSDSVLKCVLWQQTVKSGLPFEMEDGQEVGLLGSLRFNGKRSESELIVARAVNLGEGGENRELLLLKARLEAEGLFSIEHKKPVPKYPKRIGIVSSKEGDAIRDICRVAHDRNPYVQLFLYHVTVQGQSAPASIIEGIRAMDAGGYDLIIVSRGGGSREDLAPFDDENVVRAVYEARTPIVSGVGHERDWTLIDLVVDERFSTPTYAAQGVIPDVMSDIRRVRQLESAIRTGMRQILRNRMLLLKNRRERLERYNPEVILQRNKDRLKNAEERLGQEIRTLVGRRRHRLEVLVATLDGRSPTAKLVGGFGYITRGDRPVVTVDEIHVDDELQVRIRDGVIRTSVTEVMREMLPVAVEGGNDGGE